MAEEEETNEEHGIRIVRKYAKERPETRFIIVGLSQAEDEPGCTDMAIAHGDMNLTEIVLAADRLLAEAETMLATTFIPNEKDPTAKADSIRLLNDILKARTILDMTQEKLDG